MLFYNSNSKKFFFFHIYAYILNKRYCDKIQIKFEYFDSKYVIL